MALNNDDFGKLGKLLDSRDEKLVSKMGGMIGENNNKMLMQFGKLMDERLLKFHEEVIEPMINNIVESLREDITKIENNTFRIEKKLDNITDYHSEKIGDHEKRIVRLEKRITVSL